jgi:hypothetical protein
MKAKLDVASLGAVLPTCFSVIETQGSGTRNQSAVAATMGAWGKRYNPQFIVALGKRERDL